VTILAPLEIPLTRPLTEQALCSLIGMAAPGDAIEYFRGFLAVARDPNVGKLPERERAELVRVARRAIRAAEAGLVHLVQRRLGPEEFSYLAIVRPRPTTAAVSAIRIAEAA
jgi:hypothetical protein